MLYMYIEHRSIPLIWYEVVIFNENICTIFRYNKSDLFRKSGIKVIYIFIFPSSHFFSRTDCYSRDWNLKLNDMPPKWQPEPITEWYQLKSLFTILFSERRETRWRVWRYRKRYWRATSGLSLMQWTVTRTASCTEMRCWNYWHCWGTTKENKN